MPKYLKGLNQAVAMPWPLFSPRAWEPAPPASPSRPKVWRRPHPWSSPVSWVTAGTCTGGPAGRWPWTHWTSCRLSGSSLPGSLAVGGFSQWDNCLELFLTEAYPGSCKHLPKPAPSRQGGPQGLCHPGAEAAICMQMPLPHSPHLSLSHDSHSLNQFPKLKTKTSRSKTWLWDWKKKKEKPLCLDKQVVWSLGPGQRLLLSGGRGTECPWLLRGITSRALTTVPAAHQVLYCCLLCFLNFGCSVTWLWCGHLSYEVLGHQR